MLSTFVSIVSSSLEQLPSSLFMLLLQQLASSVISLIMSVGGVVNIFRGMSFSA